MFDDRNKEFKNVYVDLNPVRLSDYEPFVGKAFLERLQKIAEPLQNKIWANVNSTCVGGGVAEMLQGIIPFARGLGIDGRWFVLEGSEEFFRVTKKFHNLLQGIQQPIALEEIFHAYLDTLSENTKRIKIIGDVITIHDPQPAAMIMSGILFGHTFWRCHIDTSRASRRIWRFLLPYINHYSGAIFTAKEFIRENLQIPAYEITPSIDPLRKKNREYTRKEALNNLHGLFKANGIDPERPIIAAVSRYDVHKNQKGIIRSFRLLKEKIGKKHSPVLIMIGNSATDDPEGAAMLESIREEANGASDIHLFVNIENNDIIVGSLMAAATCFVHLSTREGFGLVVSEAMWQKTPVIGSAVGGIQKQIVDGVNGFLVEPDDYELTALRMQECVENPELRNRMGAEAKEFVRKRFLLPVMMEKELALIRYAVEIDKKMPPFRINGATYSEIIEALYGRSSWPFEAGEFKKQLEADPENENSPA
ncbi:MAG: glycosyltransferase [Candidatus Omnitrophota bacterium]